MSGYYLVMCLTMSSLHWHALSGRLYAFKEPCIYELLDHADYLRCRCDNFVVVLEPNGPTIEQNNKASDDDGEN